MQRPGAGANCPAGLGAGAATDILVTVILPVLGGQSNLGLRSCPVLLSNYTQSPGDLTHFRILRTHHHAKTCGCQVYIPDRASL